jgi:type III secretion system low calcium response chaperone LcrH/SycD
MSVEDSTVEVEPDILKKALRKIGQTMESKGMLPPDLFTDEDISLLYSLGFNLYNQEDYLQAKIIFQRLVIAEPHEKKFWMALGASLQMLKLYEDALVAWAMASFLQDEDPLPHFHAAECLLCIGKYEEVHKALHEAKQRLNPHQDTLLSKKITSLENTWELRGRL